MSNKTVIMQGPCSVLTFAVGILSQDQFQWFIDTLTPLEQKTTEVLPLLYRLYMFVIELEEDGFMTEEYYNLNKAFFDGLTGDIKEAFLDMNETISTYTPGQLKLMGEFVTIYRQELADREACEQQLKALFKD